MTHFNRAEWGARPASGLATLLTPARVEGIALHWPAMANPLDTVTQVKAALRGWQSYHMDAQGWSDIAYQEAIDQDGNVYRLRGLRYRSAANGDENVNERFGALLLVVAPGEHLSDDLTDAVRRRIRRHQYLFPRSRRIVPHSLIRPEPTFCPGNIVREAIRAGDFDPDHRSRS